MKTFFYILSVIGAILGGLFLLFSLGTATGAPQEAAGAAIAACIVIIPYVFARSVDRGTAPNALQDLLKRQIEQNNEIIALLKKPESLTLEEKSRLYK